MRKPELYLKSDPDPDDPRAVIPHYYEINVDIACNKPDDHWQLYRNEYECRVCKEAWFNLLPWQSNSHSGFDNDAALCSLLKVPATMRKLPRYSKITKDIWVRHYGEQWQGYTLEQFGIDTGKKKPKTSNPHNTIHIQEKPEALIQTFRTRIAFESQKNNQPVWLEIINSFNEADISIKGLDNNLEIGTTDLIPILRAREFIFNKLVELNSGSFNMTVSRFMQAARRLGRKRKPFTKPNLCIEMGGYKSRNTYYAFINDVIKEAGKAVADKIEERIEEQYKMGQSEPKLEDNETIPMSVND
jgi:hypothetical protein